VKLQQAKEQTASAASGNVLVAGTSGLKVKVAYVFASSSVAGTVTFESGATNRRWELYMGANGGATATAPFGEFLFETAAGESLTWDSDITGNHFVAVLYTIA
jgi:hypothetical protein